MAAQAKLDGGFNHLNVESHMHGELTRLVRMLLDPSPTPPMWQNFWLHALNQVYGDLGQGRRLLTSSITYELLLKSP